MNQCPLAYVDPCTQCAQYGNCSPSKAVQKIEELESLIQDLKKMINKLAEHK